MFYLFGAQKWSACLPEPWGHPPLSPSPRRVFLALVEEAEDRGTVVAQGGGKVSWSTDSFLVIYKT